MKLLVIFGAVLFQQLVNGQEGIKTPCKTTADCKMFMQPSVSSVICEDGYCKFKNEKNQTLNYYSNNGKITLRPESSELMGNCSTDKNCITNDSTCQEGKCMCIEGFFMVDNKTCKEKESLGEKCEKSEQCKEDETECTNQTCACKKGFHKVSNICEKSAAFKGKCEKTQSCTHVKNAKCINGTCDCKEDSVISSSGTECLQKVKVADGPCKEDVQCNEIRGEGTACVDGECKCAEKYHINSKTNNCTITKVLKDECTNNEDCYQEEDEPGKKSMICKNKYCTCAENFEENDKICTSGSSRLALTFATIIFTFLFLLL